MQHKPLLALLVHYWLCIIFQSVGLSVSVPDMITQKPAIRLIWKHIQIHIQVIELFLIFIIYM